MPRFPQVYSCLMYLCCALRLHRAVLCEMHGIDPAMRSQYSQIDSDLVGLQFFPSTYVFSRRHLTHTSSLFV